MDKIPNSIGNTSILQIERRVAFLSSQRVASQDIIRCYDWATQVRNAQDICVMSGFQSALEKEVLRYLLRGSVPIILVLARSMWKKVPEELKPHLENGRLTIVSPVTSPRASRETAQKRNKWILQYCTSVVLGTITPKGMLDSLLEHFPQLKKLRLDEETISKMKA